MAKGREREDRTVASPYQHEMPAAGGALLDVIGAPGVFALCGAVGIVGYRTALLLPASRVRGTDPRRAAGLVTGDEP